MGYGSDIFHIMDIPPPLAMTDASTFALLAEPQGSFLPWALLLGSSVLFIVVAFLFARSLKQLRERREDQALQGYTPNATSRRRESRRLLKSVVFPGVLNLVALSLLTSSLVLFSGTGQ